jgi:hypothetical protein
VNEQTLKRLWQRQDEEKISAALDALLQHEHGRKFLWWLLEICGIGMNPFARNALDTAFNCGEVNIGQKVLARITEEFPDGYITMMKENAHERKQRADALAGARADSDTESEPDSGPEPDADSSS